MSDDAPACACPTTPGSEHTRHPGHCCLTALIERCKAEGVDVVDARPEWLCHPLDHCESCPWSGCQGCRYKGSTDPQAGAPDVTNQLVLWDNWDGKDGRSPAPTDDLPEPPRFDLTEQEGLPTW